MMRKIFVLLLFSAVFWGIAISGYDTDKEVYSPGDKGMITLSIDFDYPVSSSEELVGFEAVNVELESSVVSRSLFLGRISPGVMNLTFPLEVSEDAKEGVYAITVKISATANIKEGGDIKDRVANTRGIAVVKVAKMPKLSLNIVPNQINKTGSLVLEVCSTSLAREVSVESDSLYIDGGRAYFDEVQGCSSKEVVYDASQLQSGETTISVVVSYKDILGEEHEDTFNIPLVVSRGETRFIMTQQGDLLHKTTSPLLLKIENRGARATDLRIEPVEGLLFPGQSELFVGEVGPFSSLNLEVPAYTELPPGTGVAKIEVRWKEEGKEKSEQISLPLKVVDTSPIDVFIEANPTPLVKGKEHTISAIVANRASYPISAVTVSMDSDILQSLEVQKEKFVGSLEADDFSSQQFKVRVLSSGEGKVLLNITYRDPSGVDRSISKELPITATEEKRETSMIELLIVLAVILAGGAALVKKFREKR